MHEPTRRAYRTRKQNRRLKKADARKNPHSERGEKKAGAITVVESRTQKGHKAARNKPGQESAIDSYLRRDTLVPTRRQNAVREMKPGISSTVMQHVLRKEKEHQGQKNKGTRRAKQPVLARGKEERNRNRKTAFGGKISSGANSKHADPVAPASFGHGGRDFGNVVLL